MHKKLLIVGAVVLAVALAGCAEDEAEEEEVAEMTMDEGAQGATTVEQPTAAPAGHAFIPGTS